MYPFQSFTLLDFHLFPSNHIKLSTENRSAIIKLNCVRGIVLPLPSLWPHCRSFWCMPAINMTKYMIVTNVACGCQADFVRRNLSSSCVILMLICINLVCRVRQMKKTYLLNDEYLKKRFSRGNAVAVGARVAAEQKRLRHSHAMRCKAHNMCLRGSSSISNWDNLALFTATSSD